MTLFLHKSNLPTMAAWEYIKRFTGLAGTKLCALNAVVFFLLLDRGGRVCLVWSLSSKSFPTERGGPGME